MPVAAIIGAVVSAAAGLGGAHMQAREAEKARRAQEKEMRRQQTAARQENALRRTREGETAEVVIGGTDTKPVVGARKRAALPSGGVVPRASSVGGL